MNTDNGFSTIFTPNYYEQSGSNETDVVGNFNQFNPSYTFQQSGELIFNTELEDGAETADALYLNRSMFLHTMSPLLAAVSKRDAELQSYLNQHLDKTAEATAVESNFGATTHNVECNLIADCPVLCRAKASLPKDYLTFGEKDSDAIDHSVYAQRYIPHPTKFGPYAGETIYASELELDVLQVQLPRHYPLLMLDATHILDVSNENKSNWMRYVRLASNELERNLCLQLDEGEIYLRTTRPINVGDELRVGHWQCGQCEQHFVQPSELQTHLLDHQLEKGGSAAAAATATAPTVAKDAAIANVATTPRRKRSQRKPQPRLAFCAEAKDECALLSSDDVSIRCRVCRKLFMTNDSLRQHMHKQHMPLEQRRRKRRQTHRRQHGKQAPHAHTLESAVKSSTVAARKVLAATRALHKCNFCAKRFCTLERLAKHKLTHAAEGEKPHVCVVCAQQCATRTALVAHLQSHAPTSYTCVYCEQRFRYVRHFKAHVGGHCGADGLYHCRHCQKTYTAYHLVRKHVRIFHSARQFNCPQCDKAFPNASNLQRHKQTHTQRKEQQCSLCDRAFLRRDQLSAHVRRVHASSRATQNDEAKLIKSPVVDAMETETVSCCTATANGRVEATPKAFDVLEVACATQEYQTNLVECVLDQPHARDVLIAVETLLDGAKRSNAVGNEAATSQLPSPTPPSQSVQLTSPLYPYKCHLCSANAGFKRRGILVNHFIKQHPEVNLTEVQALNTPLTRPQLEFPCPCCANVYKSNAKRKGHMTKHHPTYKVQNASGSCAMLLVGSTAVDIHKCHLCPRQYAARNRLVSHYRKAHPHANVPTKEKHAVHVPTNVVEDVGGGLFLSAAVDESALLTGDVSGIESCSSVTNCVGTPFLEPEINITENKLLKLSSAALELSRFDFLNERSAVVGDEFSRLSATLFDNECNGTAPDADAFAQKVDYKTLFT